MNTLVFPEFHLVDTRIILLDVPLDRQTCSLTAHNAARSAIVFRSPCFLSYIVILIPHYLAHYVLITLMR
jgi:hypothetical protein